MVSNDQKLDNLIPLLKNQNKEFSQNLLKSKNLPFSGTWISLEEKIRKSVEEGHISIDEWAELIDRVEGSGYQHIFIYKCDPEYLDILRSESFLKGKLDELNLSHLLNKVEVEYLPDTPTLVSIKKDQNSISMKWVEKREWKVKIEETLEEKENNEVLKRIRYKKDVARGVVLFKIDLTSGIAQIRIERFKAGDRDNNYFSKLEYYRGEISKIIDLGKFSIIKLDAAIKKLISLEGEVRMRNYRFISDEGNTFDAKSRSKRNGFSEDRVWRQSIGATEGNFVGKLAYIYWIKDDSNLSKDIGVKIYKDSNEINILPQCSEEELNYVLSRIIEINS